MMLTTSYRSNAWSDVNRRSRQRTVNSNSGIASLTSLYILVAFVGSNIIMGVHGEECGQEEFTKCAEPLEMLHLTSEFSIGAAKKDELDKLCNELRKGVRCIQSYTRRCMPLQQRNQFNKLYHGTNQFIRDLCNEGDFQDEYLKHAPCSEMAKKEFEVCANRYKETMLFLKPNKNQEAHENITLNENIKTICCSINELVDCSEDAARKICGPEAAKFTRELVDKYANSLTKMLFRVWVNTNSRCFLKNKLDTYEAENRINLKMKANDKRNALLRGFHSTSRNVSRRTSRQRRCASTDPSKPITYARNCMSCMDTRIKYQNKIDETL